VPGRGAQPAQALLEHVAASDYAGEIIIEINTRKAIDQQSREADLLESLAFARLHATR
jgi:sugar phosphate isomerase/epimerase